MLAQNIIIHKILLIFFLRVFCVLEMKLPWEVNKMRWHVCVCVCGYTEAHDVEMCRG